MPDSGLIAHIPARGGSKRCPAKNIRLMDGKPMIAYAIEVAQKAAIFDEIVVNSDDDVILEIAETWGVTPFKREDAFASDTATGDDFTFDFLAKRPCDTLIMINPVCPLISAETIKAALAAFRDNDADTLISCSSTHMQGFCDDKPINIKIDRAPLRPSQENMPIRILNWAVTIWDAATFLRNYADYKGGYLGTRRHLFPIPDLEAIKVSEEKDFLLAEALIRAARSGGDEARYWSASGPVGAESLCL